VPDSVFTVEAPLIKSRMKTTFCEGNFGSTNWRTSLEKYTQSKIRDKGLIDIQPLNRATIAQQRVRMEGWRQRWLGSMGTIWKKKKERRKKKRRNK
jgi:hypothetical protein